MPSAGGGAVIVRGPGRRASTRGAATVAPPFPTSSFRHSAIVCGRSFSLKASAWSIAASRRPEYRPAPTTAAGTTASRPPPRMPLLRAIASSGARPAIAR
jgi:hypothetical protein